MKTDARIASKGMNAFEKVDFSIWAPPQLSAAARSGLTSCNDSTPFRVLCDGLGFLRQRVQLAAFAVLSATEAAAAFFDAPVTITNTLIRTSAAPSTVRTPRPSPPKK
jgi:hypothetical protein